MARISTGLRVRTSSTSAQALKMVDSPVEVFVKTVKNESKQLLSILLLEAIELRGTSSHSELNTQSGSLEDYG